MKRHGEETIEKIQQWKHTYRKVVDITVVDGEDEYVGYFKSPDIKTLSAVQKLSKTDEFESAVTLIKNCWLGGAQEIQTDGILLLKVGEKINEMFGSVTAKLKNL